MNKSELIKAVAAKTPASQAAAAVVVNAVIDVIAESLAKGETVQLIGFGSFSVRERAAREGRNPQTGKTVKIPAKKVVKFKPGTALADSVNKAKKK
jgi:DNA-binding protein HU-beta